MVEPDAGGRHLAKTEDERELWASGCKCKDVYSCTRIQYILCPPFPPGLS
jgi:hypothetical protein